MHLLVIPRQHIKNVNALDASHVGLCRYHSQDDYAYTCHIHVCMSKMEGLMVIREQ